MKFGEDARAHHFDSVTVFGQSMLFTTAHLDHDTIPKGLYLYAVRHHSEDYELPIQICEWAVVNRYGSLLSTKPIALQRHPKLDNSMREIDPEKDWCSNDEEVTLMQYLRDHPISVKRKQDHQR